MIVVGGDCRRVDEFSVSDDDVNELVAIAESYALADVADRLKEAYSDNSSVDRGTARAWCAEIANLTRAGAALQGAPRVLVITDEQLRELSELAEEHGQLAVSRTARHAIGTHRVEMRHALGNVANLLSAARAQWKVPDRLEIHLDGGELAEAVAEYVARRGVTVRGARSVIVRAAGDSGKIDFTVGLFGAVSVVVSVDPGGSVADRRAAT